MREMEIPDYYELLEISPQATQDTIHRVYRYMAARYHPDNLVTGESGKVHPSNFGLQGSLGTE